jgi:glycosyltransferase involved in cell wall biosynthesis
MPRYRDYDVFLLPTGPGEGIPRVLMEAMAAGLPVITTRGSGITSLIEHDVNGLLIDQGAPAAAVAAAVARLIGDPALRRRLIQGGYETARSHTLERQAAAMMRIVAEQLHVPVNAVAQVA